MKVAGTSLPTALAAILLLSLLTAHAGAAECPPLTFGDPLPKQPATAPAAEARADLGLQEGTAFTLSMVEANVVVVELLNVHCPP